MVKLSVLVLALTAIASTHAAVVNWLGIRDDAITPTPTDMPAYVPVGVPTITSTTTLPTPTPFDTPTSANATTPINTAALVATVVNGTLFCSFLPPTFGGDIAGSEGDAVAFCTAATPDAPGANIYPAGFIKTAHFATGNGYVQVTGTIDGSQYGLSPADQGGQYDNQGPGSPPGASCANSKKFVNLVEPNNSLFCIRCCTDASLCDTGKSTAGCEAIIPGDYS